jgi:hypothetical protein
MDRDAWYRDRILWKAEQHKLFDKRCCKFSDLPERNASIIDRIVPLDINPVIVFWESKNTWTLLGTKGIFSFHDGELVFSDLDKINKQLSVYCPKDADHGNIKSEASFIKLDALGKLIWAPIGSELFALMNILQMFPLA